MAFRITTPAEEVEVLRRWETGLTWMAHPEAQMQRTSHAIVGDGGIWLIDPLDGGNLDDKLAELGSVEGVAVLASEHHRHADRLAARHDVPIHVPEWFEDEATDFDAEVVPFTTQLADTGFDAINLKDGFWQEAGLYHPDRKTLVVSDSLMTALFTGQAGRLELFPPARLDPPTDALGDLSVDRLLLGHGQPVVEDVEAQIDQALAMDHRTTVGAFVRNIPILAKIVHTQIPV